MSGKALDRQTMASASIAPRLAKDDRAEYKVVGVSFHQENFERLRKQIGRDLGEDATVRIILRHEPENKKSPSRSAVAVYSEGLHLGHIPEVAAPIFASLLKSSSGLARADARIYFGITGPNSLRLRIELPPRFEHQERKDRGLSKLQGDGEYSFPMRTKKYPIDWEALSARKTQVPVLEVGESFVGDDGVLTIGEFGRSPYFFCHYGYIAKPKIADERKVNESLAVLGGQASVSYKLTRTGLDSHELALDWIASFRGKAAQANRSSQKANLEFQSSSELRPLRWPGESDSERVGPSQNRYQKVEQNYRWEGFLEILSKVLKVLGKVVMYMTLGVFIISFMLIGSVLKDSTKSKKGKW
jgi:hypothetical protein